MGSGPLIIHREDVVFDKPASSADQDGASIYQIEGLGYAVARLSDAPVLLILGLR